MCCAVGRGVSTLVLSLLLFSARPAVAETIDLSCTMPWWNFEWNPVVLGPMGQSFVAARDRVGFVDLLMAEGSSNSSGVEFLLRMHEGSLDGAVVGDSAPELLEDGFNDLRRFRFDPPLPLEVGATYTFEIVRIGTAGYAMVRGSNEDPCPQMHAWIGGEAKGYADLWLYLGVESEVPITAASWSTLKSRYGGS